MSSLQTPEPAITAVLHGIAAAQQTSRRPVEQCSWDRDLGSWAHVLLVTVRMAREANTDQQKFRQEEGTSEIGEIHTV